MPDEQSVPMRTLAACPNCGANKYNYGSTISERIVRTLDGIKDFKLSNLLGLFVYKNSLVGVPRSFIREVVQGVKSTPLLICTQCRSFVTVCPDCGACMASANPPELGEIVNCASCKLGFCTSERSDEFDRLVPKLSRIGLIVGAILGVVGGLIASYALKILFKG